jgi:hypothetical protein
MGNIHLLERRCVSWLQERQSHSIHSLAGIGGHWRALAGIGGHWRALAGIGAGGSLWSPFAVNFLNGRIFHGQLKDYVIYALRQKINCILLRY